jgi:hypothetical protein
MWDIVECREYWKVGFVNDYYSTDIFCFILFSYFKNRTLPSPPEVPCEAQKIVFLRTIGKRLE